MSDATDHQHLCLVSHQQLFVSRHHLSTFGCQAFSVAGPMALDSLTNSCDLTQMTTSFCILLKSALFTN